MKYECSIRPIIEAHYQDMTKSEQAAADFFLQNREEMDFSAQKIAARLYTSEATLSRFARKCGFEGYREFIFRYRQTFLKEDEQLEKETIHILDTYQELLSKSYELIDEKQVLRVAGMLVSGRRIFVYGKGSSGIVGEELRQRLMRLGIDIQCFKDDHEMRMSYALLKEDCIVIGITVSGATQDVLRMAELGKKRGAYTILISSIRKREWEGFCDEIVLIAQKKNLHYGTLISPQFPVLILCDVLYSSVMRRDFIYRQDLYSTTLQEMGIKGQEGGSER